MKNDEVNVVSCTLYELFNANTTTIPTSTIIGQLTIPEYQRPYVWQEKQINRLIEDLIEFYQNKDDDQPLYYLGSIILHQDSHILNIIDGQQRLTTILLLCKLLMSNFKNGIVYNSSTSIKNIKRNIAYLKDILDGEIFDFVKNKNILTKNFNLRDFNVTLVVTTTEDLAYTFFETQNTGGVRLSGSDILKAHHLRAINDKKIINYQAKRWEKIASKDVEDLVQNLTKIRFWDNRKWRDFPKYNNPIEIKTSIIDEFTVSTLKTKSDISYHYSTVTRIGEQYFHLQESNYKQIKQPLSDGNNTLDYINEYVELYQILFNQNAKNYRVDDKFYEFVKEVLHGNNGTLFLKELLEMALLAYVSRFGFHKLFEATLWLFRSIYSLRVSNSRNVVEKSIFKFVKENQFLDNIVEVYTPEELFKYLQRFRYEFNTDNTKNGMSKDLHIKTLKTYFNNIKDTSVYQKQPKEFDKDFLEAIVNKISN